MNRPTFINSVLRLWKLTKEMSNRPVAHLSLPVQAEPEQFRMAYEHYCRAHPKYKLISSKSMGMALIDLRRFNSASAYLDSVGERCHAGPQTRKARARGYQTWEIEGQHTSEVILQLRSLPEEQQCNLVAVGSLQYKYCKHFGAFDQTGALAAYCRVNFYGNFAAVEELIGCKNRDGVMYMLLSEIVCRLINEAFLDYFMCDGFLDTKAGLRRFKRRLGFEPYRVRYATS